MERKGKTKKWKEKINTCDVIHMEEVGEKKSRLAWVRGVWRRVESGQRITRTSRPSRRAPAHIVGSNTSGRAQRRKFGAAARFPKGKKHVVGNWLLESLLARARGD